MDVDFLAQLQSTTGGQAQDWLVMEQGLRGLNSEVQRAVWAAAIPHWFNADFLSFLLEDTREISSANFEGLINLSFVEPFPDFGFNVHEHSRRLLLKALWQADPSRFTELSRRARDYCAKQNREEPAWQIELIYHALTADHIGGVKLFTDQVSRWREMNLDEKVEILVRTALEVVEAGRIPNKAIEAIDIADAGVKLVYGWKKPRQMEDEQLVARFLSGDAHAVGVVDGFISRTAWPYQRRLADRWDDVLQEVRLEATRLLGEGRFKGESSLRTYLWRVVSNTCLEHIRRQRRWQWSDLNDLEDPNSVLRRYVDQETVEPAFTSRQEDRDFLLRVLDGVPQECRDIWRMIVAGLSYREMSERMGIAEGTLRVRILRCREKAATLRREILGSGRAKVDPKIRDKKGDKEIDRSGN